MKKCPRCESLEHFKLQGNYLLYIYAPLGHSTGKLNKKLNSSQTNAEQQDNGSISLTVSAKNLHNVAQMINEVLSEQEMRDSKVLMLPEQSIPSNPVELLEYFMTLDKFVGLCLSQWLILLIEKKQLDTWIQPIVDSKSFKPFAWECLLRAYSGDQVITATELLTAAKNADLLFFLDREARINAINNAALSETNLKKLFINFNPTSIYDPVYCLQTTNQAVKMSIFQPQDIVFEVTESEFVHDRKHLVRITEFYRAQGYGIALDDLGSGYSSLNLLHDLNPDYIKLVMDLVRDIHQSQFKQITMQKIIELATKLNIITIAEGIETEDELRFMQTLPINYYQGYYFAKPHPISKITGANYD